MRGLGHEWSVRCCRTGRDAIAAVQSPAAAFDLVLADLGLPDISGIEVIGAVRRHLPEAIVLVVSTISSERSLLAAIRAGAKGYVLKDDSEASLLRAVRQVLEGSYPVSPSLARYLFRLAGSPDPLDGEPVRLSPKETETLRHISRGLTYAETAARMGVSLSTIQSHIRSLYRKLDAHTQAQAVTRARSQGIL